MDTGCIYTQQENRENHALFSCLLPLQYHLYMISGSCMRNILCIQDIFLIFDNLKQ